MSLMAQARAVFNVLSRKAVGQAEFVDQVMLSGWVSQAYLLPFYETPTPSADSALCS